jgi:excisionase family DNA binding protein
MQPLLKPSDVGLLLGIHVETVKVMARDGRLSGIKIGNRWRFDPSAIERFVTNGTAHSQAREYDEEVVQFQCRRTTGESDEPVSTRRRVVG